MYFEELEQSQKDAIELCRFPNRYKRFPLGIDKKYEYACGGFNFPLFLNDNPDIGPFLYDLYLPDVNFDSDLHCVGDAKFTKCILTGNFFYFTDLRTASFFHSDLRNAEFRFTKFSNTTCFAHCDLRNAKFKLNTYTGLDLEQIFGGSDLAGAEFNALNAETLLLDESQQVYLVRAGAKISFFTYYTNPFYHSLFVDWENERPAEKEAWKWAKESFLQRRNIYTELFTLNDSGELTQSRIA